MDPMLFTAALASLFAIGTAAVVMIDQRRRQRRLVQARSQYRRPRRPRWMSLRRQERVLRISDERTPL